ncbi:MAG: hypothetical protein ACOX6N_03040 [Patescibacteria group bacterium]|jgi:hypothetical protein
MKLTFKNGTLSLILKTNYTKQVFRFFKDHDVVILVFYMTLISVAAYIAFFNNGLGLAYNDARSHLNIGRRVVEGIQPGLAQLGSVWLPLPHILMIPTIWSEFMWHSGLSGALQSMISYVATAVIIYVFLKKIGTAMLGRLVAVMVFVFNINVLYLQSTAMTELLLLATMTAGAYYLTMYFKEERVLSLIKSAFFIMLSTLVRYDGWFLLAFSVILLGVFLWKKYANKTVEGVVILFSTLAFFGVFLWFAWNTLIFRDPLYFIFGPFSAHAQQTQLEEAGTLPTKYNLLLSSKIYLYSLLYNSYTIPALLAFIGLILLLFGKKQPFSIKLGSLTLIAPLIFNILALFMGHSVLYVQGISGTTWFNIRYGVMLAPSIAIFVGYLFDRASKFKPLITGILGFIFLFAFISLDAVTIDDARFGSSQKNVTQVSNWLKEHASDTQEFILISAASHDAIIFSSDLPMKRFIHEGTGDYWQSATSSPDRWAKWIVMRTYDINDLTFRLVKDSGVLDKYKIVGSFPFADIYELEDSESRQLPNYSSLGQLKP